MRVIYFVAAILLWVNIAYSQLDSIYPKFRRCTNCTTGNNTPQGSGPFNYAVRDTFPYSQVADDYGPRFKESTTGSWDWHRGLDFNSQLRNDPQGGSGDWGDLILSLESGRVVDIVGSQNFKRILIQGTHNIGYGHIFDWNTRKDSTGKIIPINPNTKNDAGGCHLRKMLAPNSQLYAIIFDINTEGSTTRQVSALGPRKGKVIYEGDTISVDSVVTRWQPIAPVGRSATAGEHLHMFHNPNGVREYNVTNSRNPMQILQYDRPDYNFNILTGISGNTNGFNPTYPGTSPYKFRVRNTMQNQSDGVNRYTRIFDINKIRIEVQDQSTLFFKIMQGSSYDSRFHLGGRINEQIYPSTIRNTFGSGTSQGVYPHAYSTFSKHPYDDYFVTDFVSRIHKTHTPGLPLKFADIPSNSKYIDGEYLLSVYATRIKDENIPPAHFSFTLDNFIPYIDSVYVSLTYAPIYSRKWLASEGKTEIFNDGNIRLNPTRIYPYYGTNTGNLQIKARSSEPLTSLTVAVYANNIYQYTLAGTTLNDIDWTFTQNSTLMFYNNEYRLKFVGTDKSGNDLFDTRASGGLTQSIRVPTRQSNSTWNPSNPITGYDDIHTFKFGLCQLFQDNPNSRNEDCPINEGSIYPIFYEPQPGGSIGAIYIAGIPYQTNYTWYDPDGNVMPFTGNVATGLKAGIYCYTIEVNECCKYSSCLELKDCSSLIDYIDIRQPDCMNGLNGSLEVAFDPDFQILNYTWYHANNDFTHDVPKIENLIPGIYRLHTQEASGGCDFDTIITLEIPHIIADPFFADINGTCAGNDGSIIITESIEGDDENYQYYYEWDDGTQEPSVYGLSAGVHCVTIRDEAGCKTDTCFEIRSGICLNGNVLNATKDSCNNGSISLTVTLGKAPMTYQWSNGATTPNLDHLAPGVYCVTVTDSEERTQNECYEVLCTRCEDEVSAYIDHLWGPREVWGHDGEISLIVNSSQSYTIDWYKDGMYITSGPTLSGIGTGNYTYVIRTANCIITSQVITLTWCETYLPPDKHVENPFVKPLSVSEEVHHISDQDSCNGSITLNILTGYDPNSVLYFHWEGPGGFTANTLDIDHLCAGTYCVTISNSCYSFEKCYTIKTCNMTISGWADETCFGKDGGAAHVRVDGGDAPYTYFWDGHGYTSQDIVDLPFGTYCVTVTDKYYCSSTLCLSVTYKKLDEDTVNCVKYVYCDGQLLYQVPLPTYYEKIPGECEYVKEICYNGDIIDPHKRASLRTDYDFDNCKGYEVNPLTNEICKIIEGYETHTLLKGKSTHPNGHPYEADSCYYCYETDLCIINTESRQSNIVNQITVSQQPNNLCGNAPMTLFRIRCGDFILDSFCRTEILSNDTIAKKYFCDIPIDINPLINDDNNRTYKIVNAYIDKKIDLNGWKFNIFPNPVNSITNIVLVSEKNNNFIIYLSDISGKIIRQVTSKVENDPVHVQLSLIDIPSGMYLISIKDQNGVVKVGKIAKIE